MLPAPCCANYNTLARTQQSRVCSAARRSVGSEVYPHRSSDSRARGGGHIRIHQTQHHDRQTQTDPPPADQRVFCVYIPSKISSSRYPSKGCCCRRCFSLAPCSSAVESAAFSFSSSAQIHAASVPPAVVTATQTYSLGVRRAVRTLFCWFALFFYLSAGLLVFFFFPSSLYPRPGRLTCRSTMIVDCLPRGVFVDRVTQKQRDYSTLYNVSHVLLQKQLLRVLLRDE